MSETTTATWRFRLGRRVRWAGDGHICTVTARRWIERQIMAPYAEYQITLPYVGTIWVGETDLDAAAGEGEA